MTWRIGVRTTNVAVVFILTSLLGGILPLLAADSHPVWTESNKAFYLDEKMASFIRPGYVPKVTSAEIAADGTIKARFTVTDPRGVPLDLDAIETPGVVRVSFIAAYIPKGQTQYVAYTVRTQTSPITGKSAVQASADTGGRTEKVKLGEYIYTFGTKAPAGYDRTATHTIGVYGSRTLTEFDLGTQYGDHVYTFVPDGSKPAVVRDVIRTEACNRCHQGLGLHGGSRRSMEVCVLCHTPQTIDPDTGLTMDMPVMTHKIHMGVQLPSVIAGGKYVIIGNQQSVHDYSHVVFPADTRNCRACHDSPATQSANVFKANRAACGACHDNVDFATGKNHANLPQVSDNQCTNCHVREGELPLDISIIGAHTIPNRYSGLPGLNMNIMRIFDGVAGKTPTIQFSIKDNAGNPVQPSQMSRLDLRLAGPNTDFSRSISESALRADSNTDGVYFWTFQQPLPADAKGSWTASIRGRRDLTLLEGTARATAARDSGMNKFMAFSADGSPVESRRKVVDIAKCNACHGRLGFHGDGYLTTDMCVHCHTPNATVGTGAAAASIDFRTMVHKIHAGEELSRGYKIGNADFGEVVYPGSLNQCSGCHVNGTENLPLKAGLMDVTDPQSFINPAPPATAACLSCHDSREAANHAKANITALGESCAVCHGAGKEMSVAKVHAQ